MYSPSENYKKLNRNSPNTLLNKSVFSLAEHTLQVDTNTVYLGW